ncbi:hypothetical protein BDV19DRAFT_180425 [Aspergillus venezuelensis]
MRNTGIRIVEMDPDGLSENTASATTRQRLAGAKAANPVVFIESRPAVSDSAQPRALEKLDTYSSTKSNKVNRQSGTFTEPVARSPRIFQTNLQSPRLSRQSIQPLVTSPHHNPENNYYRQPGCRVFRRVSVFDATKSYCQSSPEKPNSRHRRFFEKVRAKIQATNFSSLPVPTISRTVSQRIAPRRSIKLSSFLPSPLFFSDGRRDYGAKQY